MAWVLGWFLGNNSFFAGFKVISFGGMSKISKGWGFNKGRGSNIKGGIFFSSIKTYATFCSCFSRYYTKREMSRKKSCFKYYDSDTRRILNYFESVEHGVFTILL